MPRAFNVVLEKLDEVGHEYPTLVRDFERQKEKEKEELDQKRKYAEEQGKEFNLTLDWIWYELNTTVLLSEQGQKEYDDMVEKHLKRTDIPPEGHKVWVQTANGGGHPLFIQNGKWMSRKASGNIEEEESVVINWRYEDDWDEELKNNSDFKYLNYHIKA